METITGHIERITHQNEETGFSVIQLKCVGIADLVCIVGTFTAINVGEALECQGLWTRHPLYGRQFDSKLHRIKAPSDILGIKKYLGSGLIKGIGPVYATRIVEVFGKDTLNVIDETPERLSEVTGLGKKESN